jgi:RimJ/RimL family protein N-acetyltransferase
VNRLEAGTDLENIAEQRALQKAGFEREGVARQSQYRDGRYHDMVIFSRIRGGK